MADLVHGLGPDRPGPAVAASEPTPRVPAPVRASDQDDGPAEVPVSQQQRNGGDPSRESMKYYVVHVL